jgi:hydrogenase maturation protease
MKKILLLGIGNPGRGDDGLGPAFAEKIETLRVPHLTVDSDYQLMVEDSAAAAEHDVVIIVDAAATGAEPFQLEPLVSSSHLEFSSHSVEPSGVLGLCEHVFGKKPEAYLLAIRGYEFDTLREGLSEHAAANLEAAIEFLTPLLHDPARLEHAASMRK